ncbi:hypothetical protein DN592_29415 [Raoultella ornithinolytica]|nr:hypothetical protein DN592_29415 [Raoultella ornithinolytica]
MPENPASYRVVRTKSYLFNKAAYCLKIQPATGSFARNLIYSTKPRRADGGRSRHCRTALPGRTRG